MCFILFFNLRPLVFEFIINRNVAGQTVGVVEQVNPASRLGSTIGFHLSDLSRPNTTHLKQSVDR